MGGQGYYDRHSGAQKAGIARQQSRLRAAVGRLDLSGLELRLLDYGCGPGRNSMAAFRMVLEEVRRRRADLPVVCVHNDQLGNDWNDLFANVSGPEGYLKIGANIRVEVSAGSFFDRVASPGSVDFGMSFAAGHWLAEMNHLPSPGSLFFCDLPEPARSDFAALADRDWTRFLRRRAVELKTGGVMVMDALSSVPDPQDPSGRRAAGRRLYRAFWRIADEMTGEGLIDRALLDDFIFPLYFRSSEEVRAPLSREADLKAAFEVVELANDLSPMRYDQDLAESGDVAAYAAAYCGFARAFGESSLRRGLFDGSTADAQGAAALSDAYFARLEALFAAEPKDHAFDYQVMTLVLRRK